jgi:ABC-2 type transport system ATP-binding protein
VRLLSALIAPTRGSAVVAGYVLGKENEAIRHVVGILTETPGLYDRLSAWQNLLFFAELYDLPDKRASSQIERYLRLLDLWERRDDKVSDFSKRWCPSSGLSSANSPASSSLPCSWRSLPV